MRIQRLLCALLAALMLLSAVGLAETALPVDDPGLAAFSGDEVIAAAEAEWVEEIPGELPSFDLGGPEEDAAPIETIEPAAETEPAAEDGPAAETEPAAEIEPAGVEPDTRDEGPASEPAVNDEATEGDDIESEPAADAPGIEEAGDLAVETLPEKIEVVKPPEILAEAAPVQATGLTAPKLSLTVGKGENAALNVSAQPAGATLGALTYVSNKPKVASVSADGHVKGVKKGKAVITVTSDTGLKLTLNVTVMNAPKKVRLKLPKTSLGVGEAMTPGVKFPKKSGGGCTYGVDGSGVLRYDAATGTIVGVKPGTGVITVRTYNNKFASGKITVFPAPTAISPSVPAMELVVGSKGTFTAVLPKGTMASVKYASSNPGIVAIDAAGKVTGIAGGTATLTATTHNGVTCQCLA